MNCNIDWSLTERGGEYDALYARGTRAPLLQSRAYADALCPLYGQRARRGLIMLNGAPAGVVQIQEAGLCRNLIHALILDRGPVWFDGFGGPEDCAAFFHRFAKNFPRRWGRKRRILPEMEKEPGLESFGYKRLARPGYQSAWLDVRRDAGDLRAQLKKNWRNSLAAAERARDSSGLILEWGDGALHYQQVLARYNEDRMHRAYQGPSLQAMQVLCARFAREGGLVLGRAMLDKEMIGAILILCHGRAATYQIGWSNVRGRATHAHHLLLWDAILRLKDMNITHLDLGGMNDDGAGNVKKFKMGMGGDAFTLCGHYI